MAPENRSGDQTLAVYTAARDLLPRASADTDEDAVGLSDCLRTYVVRLTAHAHPQAMDVRKKLAAAARTVDADRGRFWLQQPQQADFVDFSGVSDSAASYSYPAGFTNQGTSGGEDNLELDAPVSNVPPRANAMYFLLRAEDERQVASLLEDCLKRCMSAVSECSLRFPSGLDAVSADKSAPRHLDSGSNLTGAGSISGLQGTEAARLKRMYTALEEAQRVLEATRTFVGECNVIIYRR